MNSKVFIQSIQQRLDSIAPVVLPQIVQKQLRVVGATEDTLTPEQAEEFIKNMDEALETFIGPKGKMMVHQVMMKELRRCAPNYFDDKALV